jgi:hypothetical protein
MKRLLLLFIVLTFLCFDCQKVKILDRYQPAHSHTELLQIIKEKGTDSLKINQFLHNWQQTVLPMEEIYIHQNDTIEAVFELFRLYKSITTKDTFLSKYIATWDWFGRFERSKPYFFVNRTMNYAVLEDLNNDENAHSNSIFNFRPPLDSTVAKRALFLTNELKTALIDSFLGYADPQFNRMIWIEENSELGKKHRDYTLKQMAYRMQVVLKQYPICRQINFDKTLTNAKLQLEFMGSGADLYASKQQDIWKLDSIVNTWIE